MNPNLELEEILTTTVYNWLGSHADGLAGELYNEIRNWMDRNRIIFYQP